MDGYSGRLLRNDRGGDLRGPRWIFNLGVRCPLAQRKEANVSEWPEIPKIPDEVWVELKRMQEIQNLIMAGVLDALSFPARRGARTLQGVEHSERKQQ